MTVYTLRRITVHEAIQEQYEIDKVTEEILSIFSKLSDRQQIFVLALVNRAMDHHFEKMVTRQDTTRITYPKSEVV